MKRRLLIATGEHWPTVRGQELGSGGEWRDIEGAVTVQDIRTHNDKAGKAVRITREAQVVWPGATGAEVCRDVTLCNVINGQWVPHGRAPGAPEASEA